ncbi:MULTISPECIES: 4'-phosphopantetheinyl transferase family protein [unclassified Undibacterium]|uniref:4'-phosphopantetheinyl transferase family protein n=1 Tax=unclassified Undibacterium TaxID=2630295 RepID=UPI002AC9DAF7|nr:MULTISPECIES: 4'-phosphopantetheinyl transferase superfamily protein [unclassified Undibacterium]MEB0139680.1 hypothetical protein [Undibacterium sp. CCC2.1]MEB0172561.1 hypothetical protein [Undibacterium sp. CCC1.1]MEB0176343.1 hypothetical protein [Undibacterium sp. CCC3.4]MEB0215677.1 hypothetical protein [Undibacterium sp. 5I2]WPX42955.1 hypothetical protein RHM61_16450 [Undibacterium sp. CCC3.4]
MAERLKAWAWPADRAPAQQRLAAGLPLVISLALPPLIQRDSARQQLRLALCELLCAALDCDATRLRLVSLPGRGVRALLPEREVFISISHETGLSVAALSLHHPIGIDVLRLADCTGWQDLAPLYLGVDDTERLLRAPEQQRALQFALAWTTLEAGLKCLGQPLLEASERDSAWPTTLQHHVVELDAAYVCSVSVKSTQLFQTQLGHFAGNGAE